MERQLVFRKRIGFENFDFDENYDIGVLIMRLKALKSGGATHVNFSVDDDDRGFPEYLSIVGMSMTPETDAEYEDRVKSVEAFNRKFEESQRAKRREMYLELKKEFEDE